MFTSLFRNRWVALAFVLLTAIGAAELVGDEEDGGPLGNAAQRWAGQRVELSQHADALAAGETSSIVGTTSDPTLVESVPQADPPTEADGWFAPAQAGPASGAVIGDDGAATSETVLNEPPPPRIE
ncbi:hypothetical protein J4558_13135 [Leptolyngbya sp. 15MV]|nr:hypothetical protein J4558_13135 [Leptolyngbya sp. 15MV]